MRKWSLALVLVSAFSLPRLAHAGAVSEQFEPLQVTSFVGGEVSQMRLMSGNSNYVASGVTTGGVAGFRLGPIGLGLLAQQTSAQDAAGGPLDLDKLYGELALISQYHKLTTQVSLDFGYAYLVSPQDTTRGFGGKFGLSLDYYPISVLSIGAGGAFDGQVFPLAQDVIVGLGGTFVARIGLHL
ncbi:MAG TPA: hypothetical protein VKN99_13180 [Polyangia bacterium]|nr:hypothetical protein [Polyangia bacterium]